MPERMAKEEKGGFDLWLFLRWLFSLSVEPYEEWVKRRDGNHPPS